MCRPFLRLTATVRPVRRRALAKLCARRQSARVTPGRGGEIGRRSGLKIRRPQGLVGSTPTPGTNHPMLWARVRFRTANVYTGQAKDCRL